MQDLSVVILAAGQGKRMFSRYPKVLHTLAGKSLLSRVIETAKTLSPNRIIIVHGFQGEMIQDHLKDQVGLDFVKQDVLLGTGHAVLQALPFLPQNDRILVLYGDVPLLTESTLKNFINSVKIHSIGIITAVVENPFGLGRVIRNIEEQVIAVVEEKDATLTQKTITEINTGIFLIETKYLHSLLPKLKANNAQKEYYLPDLISLAYQEKLPIVAFQSTNLSEIQGINDKLQLAHIERILQNQEASRLLMQGVTLRDPNRIDVRGTLTVGQDVIIDIDVIFEGNVILEAGVTIGPYTFIKDSIIKKDTLIKSHSVLEGATIGEKCIIGPFARIRPGSQLAENVRIGNFVEIKKSFLGENSKVNHLSYIGDAQLGQHVNIGAGTITCNYNGVKKSMTIIGDNAFIGSNTLCIAPVEIGAGATIGAGTVITKDAPAGQLTVARTPQRTIKEWSDPRQSLSTNDKDRIKTDQKG